AFGCARFNAAGKDACAPRMRSQDALPGLSHMPDLPAHRPTWAEINLDNLVHNYLVCRAAMGPDVAIMPAVKADAYGHGAIECARSLEAAGAEWFGVALPEEGLALRNAGITAPILSLGGFWEGQEES